MAGPERYETVDDLRQGWQRLKLQLEQTRSHIDRMLREYGTLEDEIYEIEKAITKAQTDLNLTEKEILNPPNEIDTFLEDLLNE